MSALLLRRADVEGALVDVRIEDARVANIGPPGSLGHALVELSCEGGALIPGLHDHHLHLMAMAAARVSVDVGLDFDEAIRTARAQEPMSEWIRAVGYDETLSGRVDRWRLDALAPGTPVRVQHRSGSLWVLSSAALAYVGAFESEEDGIERDSGGVPTGRMFRLDEWLRDRLPDDPPPDLAAIGRRLVSFGVTGVTDCTPTSSPAHMELLSKAIQNGSLPITVAVTGSPELSEFMPHGDLLIGPVKIVIADHALPQLADLVQWIHRAHGAGRPVAIHCVTRIALVLALAALEAAGSIGGDRIEHASVTPPEMIATLADRGIAVVTQPAFIAVRGDEYLRDVEPEDRGDLYRCASLLDGGVEVAGSTDAPFGPDDPWVAIAAAMSRRSSIGVRVGFDRPLQPASALGLFLSPLQHPGGPARRVEVGAPADLCLLTVPMKECLLDPSSQHVAATIIGGSIFDLH
jgi:predicted amidohydrolase YtcJ